MSRETQSGKLERTLSGHSGRVLSVSWSRAGDRLASSGKDGTVRVWDAQSGELEQTLSGHRGRVRSVSWSSADDRLASSGNDGTVRVWDAESGELVHALSGHSGVVRSVSWSSAGDRLASSGNDGTVRVWDAQSGELEQTLSGHSGRVLSVSWSRAGDRLASSGEDGVVRVWDARSGELEQTLSGHRGLVWSVSWSCASDRLASSGEDGTVRVWNAQSGELEQMLSGHSGRVLSVSWSSAGDRLASSGSDGTVRVWDETRRDGSLMETPSLVLETVNDCAVARTRLGYAWLSRDRSAIRLALEHNFKGTHVTSWFPLAGWESIVGNPSRFQQALAGTGTPADFESDLRKAGYSFDELEPKSSTENQTTHIGHTVPFEQNVEFSIQRQVENPFVAGSGLTTRSQLFGRDEILSRLHGLIGKATPCVIRGPRRSGKTWLLQALRQKLMTGNYEVFMKTLEASEGTDRSISLRDRDQLALMLDPSLSGHDSPASEWARRALENKDKRSVIILDEIVHMCHAEANLFAWIRSLGQQGIGIVLAGSHYDWAQVTERALQFPGSSFGNDTKTLELEPLLENQAAEFLLQRAPTELELTKNPQVIEWVVKRCGAWQFYLQVMGFELVEEHRAGRRQVFQNESALEDLYRQQLIEGYHLVFASRWNDSPQSVRRVLLMSRNKQLPSMSEIAPTDRRILRDCGWINHRSYWLHDPPFLDWIDTRRDELTEDPRCARRRSRHQNRTGRIHRHADQGGETEVRGW